MKNFLKTLGTRLKSWATWVAIAGALWMLLSATGVTEIWGITNEGWNAVLNAIGALLTAFGIVNNPTDRSNF